MTKLNYDRMGEAFGWSSTRSGVEIGLAEAERSSYLAAVGRNTIASFAGVILLMGSLRRTEMEGAIGRCVLDLPLENERTLLNLWQDQIAELATAVERPGLALRIIQGKETLRPRSERAMNSVRLSFELDSQELRGTGGVLRDMTEGYHADDRVLVATGAQCPLMCVERVVRTLAAADGDVVVAAHMDGTPSGFMLVRCGVLRKLPAVGFIDMKEQGLPLIAREHKVRVVQFRQATGLPVRSAAGYIEALRQHHRRRAEWSGSVFETWKPTFRIVEEGALVAADATIHDSVVLKGASVEAQAAVVGSVVCPGATVKRGQMVVDDVLSVQVN